jgi:hypothetical protein
MKPTLRTDSREPAEFSETFTAGRANLTLALAALACVFSGWNLLRYSSPSKTGTGEAKLSIHLRNHPLLVRLREVRSVDSTNAAQGAAL